MTAFLYVVALWAFLTFAIFAIFFGLPLAMWAMATDGQPVTRRAKRTIAATFLLCAVLSVAVLADEGIPVADPCAEATLRAICSDAWWWCGFVMGCPW